jgi:hypothetical protein
MTAYQRQLLSQIFLDSGKYNLEQQLSEQRRRIRHNIHDDHMEEMEQAMKTGLVQ